ncbi:hypothetical protein MMC32_002641 [Xylographa parallela]|nr:hypothetical protein [Xylographa parallela]
MATRPFSRPQSAVVARANDWSNWVEVAVQFSGFPTNTSTKDIWNVFRNEGEILTIELFDDHNGNPSGRGRIRFSPPPAVAFWLRTPYEAVLEGTKGIVPLTLKLLARKRDFLSPSLVDPRKRYPEVMILTAESLDFGFMHEPTTMMGMFRTTSSLLSPVTLRLDLLHREIVVGFDVTFMNPRMPTKVGPGPSQNKEEYTRTESYTFVMPLAQAAIVHQVNMGSKSALLFSLETPPNFYRKVNESVTHTEAPFWSRRYALFRQTDITFNPLKLRAVPLALKKTKPTIDIGRWTTYHFLFDITKTNRGLYDTVCSALRDFNIEILPISAFRLTTNRDLAVWGYIDQPLRRSKTKNRTALDDLMAEDVPPLSFPVRYQLEVCISQGLLNEHNLTKEFVDKLMSLEAAKAQDLLEYVANRKQRVYNPIEIFDIKIIKGSASRLKIPHYCTYVRSATVTPSTIYFSTPTIETSNRVIRQYSEHADRFLRVRFTDEKFQGKLNATEGESMNEIYTRVKRALNNGITIGERHFEYLASGNSQFREHGAYFFCPLAHLGVADIRRWMGDFQDIKVIARYAARLGQCFSTTRAINGSKVDIVEIPDIVNGKYNFTDGVGKISKFLAQVAASEVGVKMPSGEPPSVFQFRLGGAKGVLTVSPDARLREIHLRSSQYKFHAIHSGLEIIRWSQFSAAHLNRQLILVLSALGVPDRVFADKLKNQLSNLAQAMVDETIALTLLQKEIDPNQMTLTLAGMILEGFQRVQEPFMLSLLHLWRAWSIKYLKEKAKIVIHEGAVLLGCVDETQTLRGHYENLQHLRTHPVEEERIKSLPEVFVQLSKGNNDKAQIMLGPMLLARNPSLHPGDIRVVYGVDQPKLRHLRDVVVLPQTGDRDVAHMCSGGDLDGDDYLICWDRDLLPTEWNYEPMIYTPDEQPKKVNGNVTTDDITTFFVNYMKNDLLPRIAHAHLATADYLPKGVKEEKCVKLASHHSCAVDYPKTGVPAKIPRSLHPRMWPHFMEKRHKPKDQIYVSKKVLGQLYDLVERVDFVPELEAPFDARILGAYNLDSQILREAAEIKAIYDAAMHRIMAQHEIRTEHEVWSTFVLQHANQSKDFKFHEEMGAISASLKDRFRAACYEKAGGTEFAKIGPFVAAMYRVTSDEHIHALEECRQARSIGGKEVRVRQRLAMNMPLMSFPWLFSGILGKIANGEPTARQGIVNGFASKTSGQPKKPGVKRKSEEVTLDGEGDTLRTTEGLVHRGELLRLFVEADQPHEAASKIMTEVAASSSASEYLHDKVGEAEYLSKDSMRIPKAESLALKSAPQLEKADDTTQPHTPSLRTLIDFGVADKVHKEVDVVTQLQSNFIGNIRPKFAGSLLDFDFGNDCQEDELKSLPPINSGQDHSQPPAIDLLSLEDIPDRPAASPQYFPRIGSDMRIESPPVERHSDEGALASTGASEWAQLGDMVMKHDCDISDPSVVVTDGDGTNRPSVSYRGHGVGGLGVVGKADLMLALKDEGMVEEKVVLNLDDKPSLLERLALLSEE